MAFFKTLLQKLISYTIYVGGINLILFPLKPYIQAIIYHVIVGFKINFGSFLYPSTVRVMLATFGGYFLWRYVKWLWNNI